jgi:hypothetical protein
MEDANMLRLASFLAMSIFLLGSSVSFAQNSSSPETVTCNFDDERQLATEYQPVSINVKKPLFGREISAGKVWAPGGRPMTLFTNTPVEVGGHRLAPGAYTMFVIPNAKQWTLIVSKSTDTSGKYDENMDLVRVLMDSGELPAPEPELKVTYGHISPDQCNLRVDVASVGNWAAFTKR